MYGDCIAIIGRNGSGKSTLIKMLQGLAELSDGEIIIPLDINIGCVPQVIIEPELSLVFTPEVGCASFFDDGADARKA